MVELIKWFFCGILENVAMKGLKIAMIINFCVLI